MGGRGRGENMKSNLSVHNKLPHPSRRGSRPSKDSYTFRTCFHNMFLFKAHADANTIVNTKMKGIKRYHRKPVLCQMKGHKLCHKNPVLWQTVPQNASLMTNSATECQFYDQLYHRKPVYGKLYHISRSFMTNCTTEAGILWQIVPQKASFMTSSTKESQFYDKLYHRKTVLVKTSCTTESQFYDKLYNRKPVLWQIVQHKASFMTRCSTESQFYDKLYYRKTVVQVVPQKASFMKNCHKKCYDQLFHRKPVLWQVVSQKAGVLWHFVPQKANFMTICTAEF